MQISGGISNFAHADAYNRLKVAVLIPCYNEALTVAQVITDFRGALPGATIYVYDNNSTDDTAAIAKANGAQIAWEIRQGKGHVVRRMFRDIEADVFVLVDGDATYDAPSAPRLIDALLNGGYAMVVGSRVTSEDLAYRRGHQFGNRVLTGFVATVFGTGLCDMLSGYRVFSRCFVKSFPALSSGFEIETELTIHALELELPIIEIEAPYYSRPEGSASKLKTWSDGLRILLTIVELYRSERPFAFFSLLGVVLAGMSVLLSIPLIVTYFETGLVPRIPTAILSTGLMILAFLSVSVGFVLDTVTRGRREVKLLAYLSYPAPGRAISTVDR
jgi:glycosyltransferase involved in cell wall biosynthesis